MAWLCVNKDGQELICQNEPERWGDITKETESPFGHLDKVTGKRYITNPAKVWQVKNLKFEELSYWVDCEYFGYYDFYDIMLPEGSIEKLIGRKLTWEDNPVELVQNKTKRE